MSLAKTTLTYSIIMSGCCPKCGAFQEYTRAERKIKSIKCIECSNLYMIAQANNCNTYDGKTWGKINTTQKADTSNITTRMEGPKSVNRQSGWKFLLFIFLAIIFSGLMDLIILALLGGTGNGRPSILFVGAVAVLYEYVVNMNKDSGKKMLDLILGFLGLKVLFYFVSIAVVML